MIQGVSPLLHLRPVVNLGPRQVKVLITNFRQRDEAMCHTKVSHQCIKGKCDAEDLTVVLGCETHEPERSRVLEDVLKLFLTHEFFGASAQLYRWVSGAHVELQVLDQRVVDGVRGPVLAERVRAAGTLWLVIAVTFNRHILQEC